MGRGTETGVGGRDAATEDDRSLHLKCATKHAVMEADSPKDWMMGFAARSDVLYAEEPVSAKPLCR
jgi:hypothetical protein